MYGEKQVVAMVLLVAYANFQDRLLLALDLPAQPDDLTPPLAVRFVPPPLGARLALPRQGPAGPPPPRLAIEPPQRAVAFAALQQAVERQRQRRPRIRLPQGEPGSIYWGQVCRTYQPELAAAWATCRSRFGAEANQDAVFEASLFWVVTQAQQSFY
jgi:hypothetical protein